MKSALRSRLWLDHATLARISFVLAGPCLVDVLQRYANAVAQ